jgi:archaemetzincin
VPGRPAGALVFLALSTLDLYPREEWNFVFGQARPAKGVGVWSLARYGTPGTSSGEEAIVLSRMVRTATHETGHLLGLAHCITWRCVMNGSNHLDELDARPLEFCPACLAKVCQGLEVDPGARAGRVGAALEGFGLASDAARARSQAGELAGLASEP